MGKMWVVEYSCIINNYLMLDQISGLLIKQYNVKLARTKYFRSAVQKLYNQRVPTDQNQPYFKMQQPTGTQNQPQFQRKFHPLFKFAIFTCLITGFIIYRFIFTSPTTPCINDAYQDVTQNANRDFAADPSKGPVYEGNGNDLSLTGKAMIGTGQVLMDLWIGIFGVVWLIKTKNVRPLMAAAGFFVVRGAIFLNVQSFPFPSDIVWKSPGFFSFTVPYEHTRDFFYSGHTGSLTVIFFEMWTINYRVLAALALISLIFMINLLIMTKVHYTADIIGGLIFAIFMHNLASRTAFYTDKMMSFPYWLTLKIYNKCKNSEKSEPPKQIAEIQPVPVVTERNTYEELSNDGKK